MTSVGAGANTGSSSHVLQPPEEFCCPITGHLMRSPVTLVESYEVYDKKNLEAWFAAGNNTDPVSGVELTSHETAPNAELRGQILAWLHAQKARLAEQRAQAQGSQPAEAAQPTVGIAPEAGNRQPAPASSTGSEKRQAPPPAAPVYPDIKRPAASPPISPVYPNMSPVSTPDPYKVRSNPASAPDTSRHHFSPAGFPDATGNGSRSAASGSPPPQLPSSPPTPPSRRAADHAQSFNYGGSPPKHSRHSSRAFSEPGETTVLHPVCSCHYAERLLILPASEFAVASGLAARQ